MRPLERRLSDATGVGRVVGAETPSARLLGPFTGVSEDLAEWRGRSRGRWAAAGEVGCPDGETTQVQAGSAARGSTTDGGTTQGVRASIGWVGVPIAGGCAHVRAEIGGVGASIDPPTERTFWEWFSICGEVRPGGPGVAVPPVEHLFGWGV